MKTSFDLALVEFNILMGPYWLAQSGIRNVVARNTHFKPKPEKFDIVIPIIQIRPMYRNAVTSYFQEARLKRILEGYLKEVPIDAITVVPSNDPRYKFELYDGCHRFYSSSIVGFSQIPVWNMGTPWVPETESP